MHCLVWWRKRAAGALTPIEKCEGVRHSEARSAEEARGWCICPSFARVTLLRHHFIGRPHTLIFYWATTQGRPYGTADFTGRWLESSSGQLLFHLSAAAALFEIYPAE